MTEDRTKIKRDLHLYFAKDYTDVHPFIFNAALDKLVDSGHVEYGMSMYDLAEYVWSSVNDTEIGFKYLGLA